MPQQPRYTQCRRRGHLIAVPPAATPADRRDSDRAATEITANKSVREAGDAEGGATLDVSRTIDTHKVAMAKDSKRSGTSLNAPIRIHTVYELIARYRNGEPFRNRRLKIPSAVST